MRQESVDHERLRAALRQMSRGQLLIIAERAVELLPAPDLPHLVADMVLVPVREDALADTASLLDEVRKFHAASLRGEYFQDFDVNSKNCTEQSKGTDAFIAEFDRLTGKGMRAVEQGSHDEVRTAFELLFSLLRRIDEAPDRIVFFADEPGSWQIPVNWPAVLPAYFRCLAAGATGEDYAIGVERAISDFCHHGRPDLIAAAQREANDDQRAALAQWGARAS